MEAKENPDTLAEFLGFRNEFKPDRWDLAEQHFEHAIRLRQHIADLSRLSSERTTAEFQLAIALSQAQSEFLSANNNSSNTVIKGHIALRLKQISDIAEKDYPPAIEDSDEWTLPF